MFRSARLTLTAWYVLIIVAVSLLFSVAIYEGVSRQIEGLIHMHNERTKRFQKNTQFVKPPPRLPGSLPLLSVDDLEKQKTLLFYRLLFIDVSIAIAAGFAGYFLAGRTLRPIQRMVDEQRQFVSDASHELRTPLATLRAEMEAQLLERHIKDSTARTLITSNLEEVSRLERLSHALLESNMEDKTKQEVQREYKSLSMGSIITMAQKKVQPLMKKKKMTFQEDIDHTHVVKGNSDALTQLLVIIFDNAIKFSPAGSQIHVCTQKNKHTIEIVVADEGVGISKHDLPHIFKRFYRADKSRSEVKGFGLGLSIAKGIVSEHNGTIHVSSKGEKGTIVTMTFPAVQENT